MEESYEAQFHSMTYCYNETVVNTEMDHGCRLPSIAAFEIVQTPETRSKIHHTLAMKIKLNNKFIQFFFMILQTARIPEINRQIL